MKTTAAAILALLTLTACASTPGPAPSGPARPPAGGTAEFRVQDFAWSAVAGRNRIDGQVTHRQDGKSFGCADAGVLLTPQTNWTRARMKILYKSTEHAALPASEVRGRTPPGRSNDYSAYVRRAACDATGRFSFAGLPDGDWFAITVAKPVGAAGPEIAIMRHVSTRGGKAVSLGL